MSEQCFCHLNGYAVKDANARARLTAIEETNATEYINVMSLGVTGDGVSDDTSAIQAAIDLYKLKTLYFPAGNYRITAPLNIPTGNADGVNMLLEPEAHIFTDVSIEALLKIGEVYTTKYSLYGPGNIIRIRGGRWDAANTQYAIHTRSDRKGIHLLDLNIENVANTGLFIDRHANDGANDVGNVLVSNINITGTKNFSDNNTGIDIYGTDNEITSVIITALKNAINVRGGGNFLNNMHFTCGYFDNSAEKFNASTAIIVTTGANHFNNVYCDTYGTAVELHAAGSTSTFSNFKCWYYYASSDTRYVVFRYKKAHYVKLTGGNIGFNTNSGYNKVVEIEVNDEAKYNVRKYPTMKTPILVTNSYLYGETEDDDIYKSAQLNTAYQVHYLNKNPYEKLMAQNGWYKLALLNNGVHHIRLSVATDEIRDLQCVVSASTAPIMTQQKVYSTGTKKGKYEIGFVDGYTDSDGVYWEYLAIRALDATSYQNVSVQSISDNFAANRICCSSTTVLTNPVVDFSMVLNPD